MSFPLNYIKFRINIFQNFVFCETPTPSLSWNQFKTRKHSSRMRSARFSDSGGGSPYRDPSGQRSLEGTWDQGQWPPQRRNMGPGSQTGSDIIQRTPVKNDWHTLLKTLPCPKLRLWAVKNTTKEPRLTIINLFIFSKVTNYSYPLDESLTNKKVSTSSFQLPVLIVPWSFFASVLFASVLPVSVASPEKISQKHSKFWFVNVVQDIFKVK